MLTFRVVVYCSTIAVALFFAFWELRLKDQLSDETLQPSKHISDIGVLNDLAERAKRERFLRDLPQQALKKVRIVVGLKFLFVALLIVEIIVLQRKE